MKLHYSNTSPFVRKVMAAAHELGLVAQIDIIVTNAHQDESLRADNPLCKVPTLLRPGLATLIDSPVICDYLNELAQGPLIPAQGEERVAVLRLQAIADGMMDAAVGRRMEQLRPEAERSAAYDARQAKAVQAALDLLEQEADALRDPPRLGELALACALGYLDFRFAADAWRTQHPRLAAWYATISQRPSIALTAPPAA